MKRIHKMAPPNELEDWKQLENCDWRPRYENMGAHIKNAILNQLLEEQFYLCCYCENEVDQSNAHIEHFKPQSRYNDLSLDYNNMHASCCRQNAKGSPLHCGHAKDEKFDENAYVSLTENEFHTRIAFTGNGTLLTKGEGAESLNIMIADLRLNIPKIKALREAAISALVDMDANSIISALQSPESDGMPFISCLRSVFNTPRA